VLRGHALVVVGVAEVELGGDRTGAEVRTVLVVADESPGVEGGERRDSLRVGGGDPPADAPTQAIARDRERRACEIAEVVEVEGDYKWGGMVLVGVEVAKPRVIISVRVSTKEQQEQGFGWDNQMRRLPELVAEQGWEIAKRPDGTPGIYDEGFASTTAAAGDDLSLESRPVMQALLAELAIVQPTYLVCREVDRLHRDTLEWELLQHQLVRAGVEAIVQWPRLEGAPMIARLSESKDRAFASMQAVFASLTKSEMKTKLGNGRRERAAQGLPNGGQVPYGYRRGEPKGAFVVCEADAAVYDVMVGWAIEGLGYKSIATRLNRQGVATRSGGRRWFPTTVRGILESQAQLGMVRVQRNGVATWIPAKDQPAIISRERWEQAQAVIGSRKKYQDGRRRHVLAGLLKCSACGGTLKCKRKKITNKKGVVSRFPYYTCTAYSGECTGGYTITERVALGEIAEQINERLESTTDWTAPVSDDGIGDVEQRIGELEADEADAQRKVKRAHTAWVDADEMMAGIALEELHARQQTLKTIQTELATARQEYAQAMTAPSLQIDIEKLRTVLESWETLPDDNDRRTVLEAVIDHALVLPSGRERRLEIHWAPSPNIEAAAPTG
jgi:DNA invertase Pin-like site-specific DNA recombinase